MAAPSSKTAKNLTGKWTMVRSTPYYFTNQEPPLKSPSLLVPSQFLVFSPCLYCARFQEGICCPSPTTSCYSLSPLCKLLRQSRFQDGEAPSAAILEGKGAVVMQKRCRERGGYRTVS